MSVGRSFSEGIGDTIRRFTLNRICRSLTGDLAAPYVCVPVYAADLDGFLNPSNKSLKDFSLHRAEEATGVPGDQILDAARVYATVKPAAIVYASARW